MGKNRGERQTGQGKQSFGQDREHEKPPISNRQQQPPGVSKNQGDPQPKSTAQSAPSQSGQNDAAQRSEQTITNQDQQRQITNADTGGQPMGEEETEGDRRSAELEAHTAEQGASGSTDRKGPVAK